jgi:fructose-bisphosphate aldolase, class I
MNNNNLKHFFKEGKCMVLAYDQGFNHGISDFDSDSADLDYIFEIALKGGFTGIVLEKGCAEYFNITKYSYLIPLIVKLDGKLKGEINRSNLVCSVDYAKKLGAKGVGYTIYLGTEYTKEMIETFSIIQEKARNLKMCVCLWLYLGNKDVDFLDGVRLGLELGADVVKMKKPKDLNLISKISDYSNGVKVVLAGGEKLKEDEFLDEVSICVKKGIDGYFVGRNVWQNKDPINMGLKMKDLI